MNGGYRYLTTPVPDAVNATSTVPIMTLAMNGRLGSQNTGNGYANPLENKKRDTLKKGCPLFVRYPVSSILTDSTMNAVSIPDQTTGGVFQPC